MLPLFRNESALSIKTISCRINKSVLKLSKTWSSPQQWVLCTKDWQTKQKNIFNWQFQLLTSKFTPSSLCQLHSFYVHLSLYLVLFLPLFTLPSLSSFVSPPRPQGFRCQSVSVWRGLWPAAPGHTGAPGWYPASIPLHPHAAAAQRHVGSGRIAEPEVCVDWTGSEAGNVGGAGGRGGVLVQLLKLLAVTWKEAFGSCMLEDVHGNIPIILKWIKQLKV